MFDLPMPYKEIDGEALHATIKAELGDDFHGISTHSKGVTIHLEREDARLVDTAGRLFFSHDVSKIPPKPVRKSVEERLDEMANEITALKNKNAQLEAQAATPKK
jgi:hypothetical protein